LFTIDLTGHLFEQEHSNLIKFIFRNLFQKILKLDQKKNGIKSNVNENKIDFIFVIEKQNKKKTRRKRVRVKEAIHLF